MRIVLVTDAWFPQVNGVVRTLSTIVEVLRAQGHEVTTITPDLFRSLPCPTYPEIRLALLPAKLTRQILKDAAPEAIHIATEGPLGMAARRYCLRRGLPNPGRYCSRQSQTPPRQPAHLQNSHK